MDLEKELNKEISELQRKIQRLELLKKLNLKYPSMKRLRIFGEGLFYFASEINSEVEHCEIFTPNYSGYPDGPLLAKFYKEEKGIKIYSDPLRIQIGTDFLDGGVSPLEDWKDVLIKHGIPLKFVEQIEGFFEEHKLEEDDDE
ncbi:hypothetical protein AAGG74_16770 [Bacillus mexicanus]|uniref:hypothetical protein n=1 Tax=Bacillus mexicanus TaxID=2834415 RepID=UPI003D1A10E1